MSPCLNNKTILPSLTQLSLKHLQLSPKLSQLSLSSPKQCLRQLCHSQTRTTLNLFSSSPSS